jgi:hypothetical protein
MRPVLCIIDIENKSMRLKLESTFWTCSLWRLCVFIVSHGLINYIDTKAKCRHLKILTCIGTLRQQYIRVYRLEIHFSHVGIFDPGLWTVAPLTFSLVLSPPPPFHVWISTVHVHIQCVTGGGGYQTDKHLPQSPFSCKCGCCDLILRTSVTGLQGCMDSKEMICNLNTPWSNYIM